VVAEGAVEPGAKTPLTACGRHDPWAIGPRGLMAQMLPMPTRQCCHPALRFVLVTASAGHAPAFHTVLLDNSAVAVVRPRVRAGSLSSSELINCLKPPAHQAGEQRDFCLSSGLALCRLMRHGCEESGVVSDEERPQLRRHIMPVDPCLLWHPMLRRLSDHVDFSPTGITEECSPNSLHNYALCDIISSADNLKE
jgi:hypothetical protein